MNHRIENSVILVTGGAGFIGSHLVDRLLEQGNRVVCLDNFATGARRNLQLAIGNRQFTLIEGDIRNYEDCRKAVRGCEYVLHQAALGSVPRSVNDPVTTTDVNIGGFVKILTAAKEEGIRRFVYAVSSSAYGDHPGLPKVEHLTGKALSPYALTKQADELFARNFSTLYGIETIGLRYFNVFGPRQDPNGPYAAVIPKFTLALINHLQPVINGDGSYSRDFTFIDNVIEANQLAAIIPSEVLQEKQKEYYNNMELPLPLGTIAEVFNIAYGEQTSLNDLAILLRLYLSEYDQDIANIEFRHGPALKGDVPHSLASIEKAQKILGYRPEISVKEGLARVCKWYWENH
jgi:UDP-N-acetylglucosamine 4-epimerase